MLGQLALSGRAGALSARKAPRSPSAGAGHRPWAQPALRFGLTALFSRSCCALSQSLRSQFAGGSAKGLLAGRRMVGGLRARLARDAPKGPRLDGRAKRVSPRALPLGERLLLPARFPRAFHAQRLVARRMALEARALQGRETLDSQLHLHRGGLFVAAAEQRDQR